MSGKIFVNYRRDDDPNGAARIRDALTAKFGRSSVFMDVDDLLAGLRFDEELAKAMAICDVFLAIIGPRWMELLNTKTSSGDRDYVREEIAEAIRRKIVVIPVRVGRDGQLPPVPRANELPSEIRDLVHYQKHDVAYEHFGRDASALVDAITAVRRHVRPQPARTVSRVRWGWIGATTASVLAIVWVGALMMWQVHEQKQKQEEARLEDEARRNSETEARRLAEARRQAEEDARRQAEANRAEAIRKADEDARRQAKSAEEERQAALVRDREEAERQIKRRDQEQRNPIAALVPGSGKSARDLLADGSPCPFCPEMVMVPAGKFTMGSRKDEEGREPQYKESEDQRLVTINRPFAVSRFAVTRGEFAHFVESTSYRVEGPCYAYASGEWISQSDRNWRSPGYSQSDRHPVVCVSWNEAKAYAAWLASKTGKSYRLPSDAEREFVTRGGAPTPYWWGVEITAAQANYEEDSSVFLDIINKNQKGQKGTLPVDAFKPNKWGLYNVHGNVWEWVEDCWNDSNIGNPGNGSARIAGDCRRRVARGGSWRYPHQFLRSADRAWGYSGDRYGDLGFRLARTLAP